MKINWFLFVLFTVIYFSSRGILVDDFGFSALIDPILSGVIRLVGVLYLFRSIAVVHCKPLYKIYRILFWLIIITAISFILNRNSVQQLFQFIIFVFYPIGIGFIIIERLNESQIKLLLKATFFWLVIQFLFSCISNFDKLISSVVVDDPFFGFFSFPRAYHFSVFAVTVVLLIISFGRSKIIKTKIGNILLIMLIATPVLAGAGRVVFSLAFSIALVFIFILRVSFFKRMLLVTLLIPLSALFERYANIYSITGDIFNSFISNPYSNLKFYYFVESMGPLFEDPIYFLFGQGPGSYMSSSAKMFRPDLVDKFNESLHHYNNSDIYQAFNNIIGFLGDTGIFFLILYYYMYIKIYKLFAIKDFFALVAITFFIIFSIFFQIFDEPYFSLSVWIFIGVEINKSIIGQSNIREKII